MQRTKTAYKSLFYNKYYNRREKYIFDMPVQKEQWLEDIPVYCAGPLSTNLY